MSQRYTWNKDEKLKSRKRIDQVFKKGKSFSVFPFKVFYVLTPPATPPTLDRGRPSTPATPLAPTNDPPPTPGVPPIQAGFGAGSRHFKKAVDRNRIKRLCREGYRLQKHVLVAQLAKKGQSMAIFFVYIGKDLPDYQTITGKIGVILQKLVKETA